MNSCRFLPHLHHFITPTGVYVRSGRGRYACWGLRTAVLREQYVGGVKFIGSSELWCWEVVKLLSYNTRRWRGGGEESCCVLLLSVHLVALPCLALFTTGRPLNTRIFTVRETLLVRISLQDKRSIYIDAEVLFPGCLRQFLERVGESILGALDGILIAGRSGGNVGNMKYMQNFGWRTSVEQAVREV
jgi:hypothetical protein